MKKNQIPKEYDYVGVYLTNKCHLSCSYCITGHHCSEFQKKNFNLLSPDEWIKGLNRFVSPQDVPITLQGGEPFLYKGIWEILEGIEHKVDILTAFPDFVKREDFLKLRHLNWNKREAPYPRIRVSYHQGQNDYKDLIDRISEVNDILSIGLYYLDHPGSKEEVEAIKEYAKKRGVELRKKDFLGEYNGAFYGQYLYPDAVHGIQKTQRVLCKNTVIPISCDGMIYKCHSDLYFNRSSVALGHILDDDFSFPDSYIPCENYGLCSECDVKIKNNHYQKFGYTSVQIKFESEYAKT